MATESAPLMIGWRIRSQGGDSKSHRQPVIPGGVGVPPSEASRTAQMKSVREFFDIRSERLKAAHERS